MQTYNQIIKLNREFADAHYQIKTFGNGEAYNIVLHDKEAWFEYPLMWVEDQTLNINNNEFTFNFRVYFIAQVAQVTDQATDLDSTNENEVKSDMVQCAQDLLSYWAQDVSYLELDLIKTGNSITTITDKFSDRVTGCYVDLRLKQGFTYNKCAIPMSDVPVSPAVCLPATYTNSDGSFTQEIPSGGTYTAPDIVNQVGGIDQAPIPANTSTNYPALVGVVDNTMNGDELIAANPGTTKDFTITYANSDPVVVTEVSDSATAFLGTVPDLLDATYRNSDNSFNQSIPSGDTYTAPDIVNSVNGVAQTAIPANTSTDYIVDAPQNSSTITKTGANVSYNTGDDGDLQEGRCDFSTIPYLNPFGTNDRYTDILGGQVYADDIICDWAYWDKSSGDFYMWNRELTRLDDSYLSITEAQAKTYGGFNNWRLPNFYELILQYSFKGGYTPEAYDRPPFNLVNGTLGVLQLWSCTISQSNGRYMVSSLAAPSFFGRPRNQSGMGYIVIRNANISEL